MEVTPPETPVRGRALQPEPTPSPSDFRDPSISGFSDEGPAASLRLELDRLISHSPPQARPHFAAQMNAFYDLFVRWQRTKGDKLDWNRVRGLTPDDPSMARYDSLKQVEPDRVTSLLSKLAIIKLNGGLGTTMGLKGPKSAIEVRQGLSFLDLCVLQVRYLNRKYDVNVPLVLMNSFNTHEMTEKLIKKYDGDDVDVRMFEQSVAPRISRESLLPVPHKPEITEHTKQNWYPPGHGDIWVSLERSGILDELLEAGKQWLARSLGS